MRGPREKLTLALTLTAVVAVSVLALIGLPHLASAAKTSSSSALRTADSVRGVWFAPLLAPAHTAVSPAHAGMHSGAAGGHAAAAWGASAGAAASGGGSSTNYPMLHHCSYMPRYNQLRA